MPHLIWFAFFAGLALVVVRRDGWQHVPFVLFVAVGHWYGVERGFGYAVDFLALLAIAGVWFMVRGNRIGEGRKSKNPTSNRPVRLDEWPDSVQPY